MLAAGGTRGTCPKCQFLVRYSTLQSSRRASLLSTPLQSATRRRKNNAFSQSLRLRPFSTTTSFRQQEPAAAQEEPDYDLEQFVRGAKQRFRDTLPKGYLSEKEYELYERLYGPPLRETLPEDVGIPQHAELSEARSNRGSDEATLLREVEGGQLEEVANDIQVQEENTEDLESNEQKSEDAQQSQETEGAGENISEGVPGYINAIARNQREHDALQKLATDFETTRAHQKELEKQAEADKEEEVIDPSPEGSWPPEPAPRIEDFTEGEEKRFHPLTLRGKFATNPVEISLPQDELLTPIQYLLERAHLEHVKAAAETAFAGPGLPTSPTTPFWRKNGNMGGVGLAPDQRHMTEIEADAFLAAFVPPAYASVYSVLREVRRRVGPEWLQSRLKQGEKGGLSVLDAGTGGAGLVAWEQLLKADWELLKERGEVRGIDPLCKKTTIIASERLRYRVKEFLPNTTILPRLPDYQHSGEMRGQRLDGGGSQPRKKYDVVIASHLFLREEAGYKRSDLLEQLWTLVKEDGGILVLIEKAHPRGFEAVAQARDTLLKDYLLAGDAESVIEPPTDVGSNTPRKLEAGHIIAPCTNQRTCPMYQIPGKAIGRKDYCHFSQRFVRPMFNAKMYGNSANKSTDVEFSYIAVQRGVAQRQRSSGKELTEEAFEGYEKSEAEPDMQTLPRITLPPLKRKGHVTMDLCTPEGKIERWTIPKSYSNLIYHDARKSRWGDLWALGAKSRSLHKVRAGKEDVEADTTTATTRDGKPRKASLVVDAKGQPVKGRGGKKSKKDRQAEVVEKMLEREKRAQEELGEEIDAEIAQDMKFEMDERRERGGES